MGYEERGVFGLTWSGVMPDIWEIATVSALLRVALR